MRFLRKIKTTKNSYLTSLDIKALREQFKTDDQRGERITVGAALWPQMAFAHQAFDSKIVEFDDAGPEAVNRYDFRDNGTGVYGDGDPSAILFDKSGRFKMGPGGDRLPVISWQNADGSIGSGELAADRDRVNENSVLRLLHLYPAKMHNKRIDEGATFEEARADVTATLCLNGLEMAEQFTGKPSSEIINAPKFTDMHRDYAFNFGIARLPHSAMPDTVQGEQLQADFRPDPHKLFDGSEFARVVNLGTSSAMRAMKVPGGSPDIVERTSSRHNELRLPCFADLCRAYRVTDKVATDMPNCTIWFGALLACERYGDDPHELHPAIAQMYADGVAGTLMWGKPLGLGLWRKRWAGAPETLAEGLEYAFS